MKKKVANTALPATIPFSRAVIADSIATANEASDMIMRLHDAYKKFNKRGLTVELFVSIAFRDATQRVEIAAYYNELPADIAQLDWLQDHIAGEEVR